MRSIVRLLSSGLLLVALLAAAAVSFAGGHATIKASTLPASLVAGQAFPVEFAVLHNGTTPMTDLKPAVVASRGSRKVTIPATWNAARSRYVAAVSLPEGGAWRLTIESNFCGNRTVVGPVKVAAKKFATL